MFVVARRPAGRTQRRNGMADLIFVGVTVAFFAVCVLYTYACDRL